MATKDNPETGPAADMDQSDGVTTIGDPIPPTYDPVTDTMSQPEDPNKPCPDPVVIGPAPLPPEQTTIGPEPYPEPIDPDPPVERDPNPPDFADKPWDREYEKPIDVEPVP